MKYKADDMVELTLTFKADHAGDTHNFMLVMGPTQGAKDVLADKCYNSVNDYYSTADGVFTSVTARVNGKEPVKEWKVGDVVPANTEVGRAWFGVDVEDPKDHCQFNADEKSYYDREILWIEAL